jgi:predicted nucleic acid-binding protein
VPFVVDASIVVAWALREIHPTAALALARIENDQALAPALWWFEVRNGLIVNERRGRIREARTVEFLQELERIAVAVDAAPIEGQVLGLARQHRLTVYDAAYLELALRQDLPIATLDMPLAAAARAEGVALTGEAP